MQSQVQLYLLCQWANAGGAPPCTLPNAPLDLSANASTGNVVLTWPAGVGATGYKIYRSPAPGMGPWTLVGTSVTSPYTDTTGVSGTTYYYTVSSTNACGESVGGIVESHATPIYASFLATTTGAQTLTIAALTVTAAMIVDWGDGNTDTYVGAGARTHNYAGAGIWTVKFLSPLLVTVLNVFDNKVTMNSVQIAPIINVKDFEIQALNAGTFNSSDVSAWRPDTFVLDQMPAGYAGAFNSADVILWTPVIFLLDSMPVGYAGTFNSADVSAWNPVTFRVAIMPATFAIIITAGGFGGWLGATQIRMDSDNLSQAQVDQVLEDMYVAFTTRTVAGGLIKLDGASNAAPSGIFQSACPPTSGKETAFDLLNDLCLVNPTKTWATVTTN